MTGYLRQKLHELRLFFEPEGSSARVVIGLYMFVTGTARIITGNTPAMINVFSSRIYGALLVAGAIALLVTTQRKWRCHWPGRLSAIFCAALWLFVIASAWAAGAWVSISGAFVFVLALGNEVRIHDCQS